MMTATLSEEAALARLLGTVEEAMTGKVLALAADTPAEIAAQRLEHAQVSGAPVVDHGRVVGVVTLRDLLAPTLLAGTSPRTTGPFLRHERQLAGYRVHELMTREPITARADRPVAQVVLAMDEAGVNRVPVVDGDGRPVGILTRDDVLRAVADRLRREFRQEFPATRGSRIEPG